jgi:hypothetical protein
MKDAKHDPTFPVPAIGGMLLRDWFAGQALVGLLANAAGQGLDDNGAAKILAIESYDLADEMMIARKV